MFFCCASGIYNPSLHSLTTHQLSHIILWLNMKDIITSITIQHYSMWVSFSSRAFGGSFLFCTPVWQQFTHSLTLGDLSIYLHSMSQCQTRLFEGNIWRRFPFLIYATFHMAAFFLHSIVFVCFSQAGQNLAVRCFRTNAEITNGSNVGLS